jgi:SAM-dependent methyltransferase
LKHYHGLAAIYDHLVSGVDFAGWIDYVESIMKRFGHVARSAADVACGTGNTTLPLAKRGYRSYGVDISGEMLALARQKAEEENLFVEFLQADMRDFSLPCPVDLVTCFHDGLNYLTEYKDLIKTFHCILENLSPGGLFIFDLNAVRWLSGTRPEVTVVEEEGYTLLWESIYHEKEDLWEICLTGFIEEAGGELYRRFKEVHREKAYRPEEVGAALTAAGLQLLASYDAFTFSPIHEKSRRHFYVARKKPKETLSG